MNQPDGGGDFVDVLTTGAAGPVDLHFDVRRIDLHIHLVHFRQHGYRGSGGVDPAAGFGFRHPLNPVYAGFILQPGVGAPAHHQKIRFLHASQFRFAVVHQLNFPAHFGGVHGIHPKKAVGKQGAFLAADAAPDLHNHVFVVVGIFGQQQNLQLVIQLLLLGLGLGVGFLAQLFHFRIGHQFLGFFHILLGLAVGLVSFHNGFQVIFFFNQPGRLFRVGVKIRLFGFCAELFVFVAKIL